MESKSVQAGPPVNASESNAQSLDAENAKLKNEIRTLRERIAVYEGDAVPSSEPAAIQAVFRLFDVDKSGDLNVREFQAMAYQLGEKMSQEQVVAVIKLIDLDKNGAINLKEFTAWWNSRDTFSSLSSSSGGPKNSFYLSGFKNKDDESKERLQVLRSKLQSASYMRMISRLLERTAQANTYRAKSDAERSQRRQLADAQTSPATSTPSTTPPSTSSKDKGKEKVDENDQPLSSSSSPVQAITTISPQQDVLPSTGEQLIRLKGRLFVGDFGPTRMHASLRYEKSEANALAALAKYKARESASLISVGLTLQDGVDDFQLGELSGALKDIVLSVKPKFEFSDFIVTIEKSPSDERLFRLNFIYDNHGLVEMLEGVLSALRLHEVFLTAELSQSPTDPDEGPDAFLKLRANGSAVLGTPLVETIRAIFTEGEEAMGKGVPGDAIAGLTALRSTDVTVRLDDLTEMYRRAFVETPAEGLRGWKSAKEVVTPVLAEMLGSKQLPPPVILTYLSIREVLRGVHDVLVQLGDHRFLVDVHDADVFVLLPSKEDLGLEDF